jgi:cytochrome c oxidase subunit 2
MMCEYTSISKGGVMTFATSVELLKFHTVAYTIYALLIISVIAWFAYNLTRKEKAKSAVRIPFYGYIAFLVAGGVGHHIFTYNAIPWVSEDIMRHEIKPDYVFDIQIHDHKWKFPQLPMKVEAGKKVLFNVSTDDLTYGFGLFRQDGTLVTQMQVVPHHKNDLLWTFNECGKFDVYPTEYSGPAEYDENGKDLMFVKDAFEVTGCDEKSAKR